MSLQPLYNLLDREAEWELVPVCREEGVGIVPDRPGWLAHRQVPARAPPSSADTRIAATIR